MKYLSSFARTTSTSIGIALVMLISIVGLPQKTQAQLVVTDPGDTLQNTTTAISAPTTAAATGATAGSTAVTSVTSVEQLLKNTALDPLAWAVSKAVLQSVVNSTVNWINHGFNGAPGFATNLNSTLQAVSDSAANSFISQLSTNGSIKSPFQTQVASAVSSNYLQSTSATGFFTQNAYTLNQTTSNDAAFLGGNFSAGGWDAWMSAIVNPQNNPYGAYQLANAGVSQQTTAAKTTQTTELNWGQGFLSSRGNCPTSTTGKSSTSGGTTSLSQNSTCQSTSIQTPGSVISGQLNKALGTGNDTLVSAHEVDELVNALLGQLTKAVIGPGGGLSGLSQSSASTGNTTYFAQTDPTEAGISASLASSFASTTQAQLTSIQQFQTDWNSINNAAQNALTALSSNSCSVDQNEITNTVQPIITEAATNLSQASASITSLQNIIAELPSPTSTTDATTALSQASSDYSNISSTLPTTSAIAYAQAQSVDNSTNSTAQPTLLTQMNELIQSAPSCTAPAANTCQADILAEQAACATGVSTSISTSVQTPACLAASAAMNSACAPST